MNKVFFPVILIFLLSIIFVPFAAKAQGIVPCGNDTSDPCQIGDFFVMLVNIYNFITIDIAVPLAVIAIIVAAIMMMLSAGNPNLFTLGKKTLYAAIIGLVLVFCSWIIINFVVTALGYTGSWSNPF